MKNKLSIIVFILSVTFLFAQIHGTIDDSFLASNNGQKGASSVIRAMALQQDGKIILSGSFTSYNGIDKNRLVRINPDGSMDTVFNQIALTATGGASVDALAIQPDGQILVGGNFVVQTPFPNNDLQEEDIMRLNPDGTRDTSFILPEETSSCGNINSIAVQADGKIILAGDITSCLSSTIDNNENILRLNSDGTMDITFNVIVDDPNSASESISTAIIQPDGKILIGGSFAIVNGVPQSKLARLNGDGSLDTSFNIGSGFDDFVNSIVLQPDGKILVAGDFLNFDNTPKHQIVRLNADGSLDPSFSSGDGVEKLQSNGFLLPRAIEDVKLQPDGKILIGGNFDRYDGNVSSRLTRLNTDGSLDTSFNNVEDFSILALPSVATSLILPNGDILVGGGFTTYNGYKKARIVKLDSNGQIDFSFNAVNGPTENYTDTDIYIIEKAQGNKFYVGGRFREYDDTFSRNIARINANGSLDTSFSTGTGLSNGFDDEVRDIVEQPDGKIIVVGEFGSYNQNATPGIVRLNLDGSIDDTFNPGNGVDVTSNNRINSIVQLPDGKFLVGGFFTQFDGFTTRNLARLNADGSVDNNFTVSNTSQVDDIFLLGNGQFFISVFSFNGVTTPGRLAKINADATLDTSFSATGISTGSTEIVKVLSNGQLLVGGFYSSQGSILRLNEDGSLDSSFTSASIMNSGSTSGIIEDIEIQDDGKIIIGGRFRMIDSRAIGGVARLNNDGTFDDTFNPEDLSADPVTYEGTGDNINYVYSLELRSSGQLLLAGDFRSYNGEPKTPLIAVFAGQGASNFINIPDPNFEQVLIDENIDSDGAINGQMLESDAVGVTSLIMNNQNILDLTGIEAFTDLEILTAVSNNLTSINLNQNPALNSVILIQNNLSSIDVSNNSNLSTLNLTSNNISSIDLSNNTALTILNLQNNSLEGIDTSGLINLSEFVVSQNNLTELDLSLNSNLIQVVCADNSLTDLNVQNGNNININGTFFNATNNPNLTCIQVDNVAYSTTNWFLFDTQTSFSTDCNANFINIPDSNFEQALIDQGIDSDGIINGQVLESDIIDIETLTVSSSNISDLSGIEGFQALQTLFAFDNNLNTVNLSSNTALTGIILNLNALTSIDVSSNTNLVALTIGGNQIETIDLTNNTSLTQLFLEDNILTSVDVSMLPVLAQINVSGNNLLELDLSQNSTLTQVNCSDNDLFNLNLQNGSNINIAGASFDASQNENLSCIQVDDLDYTNTNWVNIDAQTFFSLDCAPSNDDCSFAVPLDLGVLLTGTSIGATSSNGFSSGCQDNDFVYLDVWYEFTAPPSGLITAVATSILGNVSMAIYSDCNETEAISCDAGTLQITDLVPGETYFVQIWFSTSLDGRTVLDQVGDFSLIVQDSTMLSVDHFQNERPSFDMFPNPAHTEVNIKTTNQIETIKVYDTTGRRVIEIQGINGNTFGLNTSKLSNGIYVVQVTTVTTILSQKLIIKE